MGYDREDNNHTLKALQTILDFDKRLPLDFDSKKELEEARDEKYGNTKQKDEVKERGLNGNVWY